MKLIRSINWKMMSGPFFFCLTAYLLNGTFPLPAAFAVGTAVWMAVWWIFRPISIYVTAFVPIVVNSAFNLIPAEENNICSFCFLTYCFCGDQSN